MRQIPRQTPTPFPNHPLNTMAPPPTTRWRAIVSITLMLLLISPSMAIYCDEDDCYDLLGYVPGSFSVLFMLIFIFLINFQLPLSVYRRVQHNQRSRKLTTNCPWNCSFFFPSIPFLFYIHCHSIWISVFAVPWSHPDKNPDPESKKQFVKIANAYEVRILKNSRCYYHRCAFIVSYCCSILVIFVF